MRRLLSLVGPAVAVVGSLGLFLFGSVLIRVLVEVLTFRIVDPPEPAPASLAELQLAVISAMALVIGLVISCIVTAVRDDGQSIPSIGRLFCIGAGVTVIAGALLLAGVIMDARGRFRTIASSGSAPMPENVQEMMQSAEPQFTIGYAILMLSAVLLLAGGLVGFRTMSSQSSGRRAGLGVAFAIGSVIVGVTLLPLLLSVSAL